MTFDRRSFWTHPDKSDRPEWEISVCRPEFYLDLDEVTKLVVDTLSRYATPDCSILEIGSGTGRNLAGLKQAGFPNVAGVEISQHAINVGSERFGEFPVVCAPIEDVVKDLPEYDVIYTQGCYQHLSPDVDWVFPEIAKKARKYLMTIENEQARGERSWRRDYKAIFEALGWQEVEWRPCGNVHPYPPTTILRVFEI
jgi:SAM-dependent methyltransferase